MSTFESAAEIASSFTSAYYVTLTAGDVAGLAALYGESSALSFTNFNSEVEHHKGKANIEAFLTTSQNTFGPRKVNVRNVDYVSAETFVAVTCSGHVYTHMMRRVFSQTFVLAPTKYRDDCFFVVGESLRFLSEEPESIPEGSVAADEYERLVAERAAEEALEARAAEKPRRARRERPERRERAPRGQDRNNTAAASAVPAPAAAAAPAPDAAPAPSAPPAAAAAAPASKQRPERKMTSFTIVRDLPMKVRLTAMETAASKFGEVIDKFWVDEKHCAIKFARPADARSMVKTSRRFMVESHGPYTVEYYSPQV